MGFKDKRPWKKKIKSHTKEREFLYGEHQEMIKHNLCCFSTIIPKESHFMKITAGDTQSDGTEPQEWHKGQDESDIH